MKVDIKKIIDAIEMTADFTTEFYDVQNGEIVTIFDNTSYEEQQELCDNIENNLDRYYRLPSQYEIHEYSIMEDFINSLSDTEIKNKLLCAIHGKSAFRRFKDEVLYLGIREDWFKFQHNAYVEIAKQWCDEHQLEYDGEVIL